MKHIQAWTYHYLEIYFVDISIGSRTLCDQDFSPHHNSAHFGQNLYILHNLDLDLLITGFLAPD
jgi:hypothetical protein